MKHLNFLLVFVCAFGMAQIQTPQPSPSTKVEQVVGLTKVTLEYSRPAMRGRTIMGELIPMGELWRAGANKNGTQNPSLLQLKLKHKPSKRLLSLTQFLLTT